MTAEDRLCRAIEARAGGVEPSTDALPKIQEALMHAQRTDRRSRLILGVGAAAAVAVLVVGAVILADDDEPVATDGSTTTMATTTTEPTTTTTAETTTTEVPFPTVDPAVPVYPDPTTSQRFDDPVSVASAFATDFLSFSSPVIGELAQGDSRSGEIEIRPFATGAPTVVLVRQLEDDTWFVIGAVTDSIQLATPAPGATIASPQPLAGMAYAFEGNVVVQLYVDGVQEPIAQTNVTGRGDGVLGDFSGELTFTDSTGASHGVLVLLAPNEEDGSTFAATVIRVAL